MASVLLMLTMPSPAGAQIINECSEAEVKHYAEIVNDIVYAVNNNDYRIVDELFTKEGADMFEKLVSYGEAHVFGNPEPTCYRYGDKVVCRDIPMSFTFTESKRKFFEIVNFTFNADDKICHLAFDLEAAALSDLGRYEQFSEQIRLDIKSFLEDYKTAFALKRLGYLNEIIDEKAMLIDIRMDSSILSKEHFLEHIENDFNSKEYLNIHFVDCVVIKGKPEVGEVYGIRVKQELTADDYRDSGYLCLIVDFNQSEKPLLKFLEWQKDKDSDFGWYEFGYFE